MVEGKFWVFSKILLGVVSGGFGRENFCDLVEECWGGEWGIWEVVGGKILGI